MAKVKIIAMRSLALGILWAGSILMSAVLHAQAPGTAAIAGRVLDPSGALVRGAHITVTSDSTDLSRAAATASDGTFLVSLLVPGTYSVVVEAPGFKRQTYNSIPLVVTETAVIDVRLEIGSVAAEVVVTGSAEMVQSESGTFAGSRPAGLRCLMGRGPWDRDGRWGLGRQAVNAPQQAKGQLSHENNSGGGLSRIGTRNARGGLPVGIRQMLARI